MDPVMQNFHVTFFFSISIFLCIIWDWYLLEVLVDKYHFQPFIRRST